MKRPLAFWSAIFVLLIYCIISIIPPSLQSFQSLEGREISVSGVISQKEYRTSPDGSRQLVATITSITRADSPLQSIKNSTDTTEYEIELAKLTGLLLYLDESSNIKIGQKVCIRGTFHAFLSPTNDGEFDLKHYYHIKGIDGQVKKPEIVALGSDYSWIFEKMCHIRFWADDRIYQIYDEKTASIICALILGEKSELDEEVKDLYQQAGILHILSISGLHISMLGMGLFRLLRKCNMHKVVAASIAEVMIWLYAIMTGMSISSLRAVCMLSLQLFGICVCRTYDMITGILFAAALLCARNPLYLTYSGFLLSFGAVCGIAFLGPVVRAAIPVPDHGKAVNSLVDTCSMALSMFLFVYPIQLATYYEYYLYSILVNLILVPFVGIVLVGAILSLLLAAILPVGGVLVTVVSIIPRLILGAYERICTFFIHLPHARLVLGRPGAVQLVAYYMVLVLAVLFIRKIKKWQPLVVAICILVAIVSVHIEPSFYIAMLDVGQGDGIYIHAGNTNMMIDGGSSGKKKVGKNQIVPFLKYHGVCRINLWVVTHPDEDHFSGLREMILMENSGIKLEALALPAIDPACRNEDYLGLEELAGQHGIKLVYLAMGDELRLNTFGKEQATKLEVLYPTRGMEEEDTNAYSTTLCLSRGDFSMLLTGDLTGEGEEIVAQKWADRAPLTILKVAHHGSKYSTSQPFLEAVKPKISLISVGANNRYGHPHEETLERIEKNVPIAKVLRTDECGQITIIVDENTTIKQFKKDDK